jgi:hypothetical protein
LLCGEESAQPQPAIPEGQGDSPLQRPYLAQLLSADALGQRRQQLEGHLHLIGSHVEPGQVDADLGIPGLDGAGAGQQGDGLGASLGRTKVLTALEQRLVGGLIPFELDLDSCAPSPGFELVGNAAAGLSQYAQTGLDATAAQQLVGRAAKQLPGLEARAVIGEQGGSP